MQRERHGETEDRLEHEARRDKAEGVARAPPGTRGAADAEIVVAGR